MNGTAQECHEHPCPGSDPHDGGKTDEQPKGGGGGENETGRHPLRKNNCNVIIMHVTASETDENLHVRNLAS